MPLRAELEALRAAQKHSEVSVQRKELAMRRTGDVWFVGSLKIINGRNEGIIIGRPSLLIRSSQSCLPITTLRTYYSSNSPTMDASSQPVMKASDPNDDPFGDLSMEFDANQLPSPADFGSGAVTSPKEAEDATPAEPAANDDSKEEAKEDAPKEDS
jgi:hypothetical protein